MNLMAVCTILMFSLYLLRQQNVLMQSINLSWNGVGNDGAKALGDALKANAALEELNVS